MNSVAQPVSARRCRAAVYMRVSSEEQRRNETIKTQREQLEPYCARQGFDVFGWYADDGVSGTISMEQRPEGARLYADAVDRKFDAVVVYRVDRLGRDDYGIVGLQVFDYLTRLGINIVSASEPFDVSHPSGRFMVGVLCSAAGFERATFIQRSKDGTNRLAREGAWLGGIVPYGYRVAGVKKEARLALSEEPIPGLELSEAGVIRLIYRMAADERASCIAIAAHLNRLGVPPAYTRDGRQVLRGKRKEVTSGIWRASRLRNIITNTTYKGLHVYGRRSERAREVIERVVPSIIGVDTWERAQQTLRANLLFSARNAKNRYLLRGLFKCGACGLTYIGTNYPSKERRLRPYYVCNGKHQSQHRGLFGLRGERCPSKAISGEIEEIVWADVEHFLRNPGDVLRQLAERSGDERDVAERVRAEAAQVQRQLDGKAAERDSILGLYRRRRIDEAALDRQLDQIDQEERDLREKLAALDAKARASQAAGARLSTAEHLLAELNRKLDQPLTWDLKRQLVEQLVEGVRADTVEQDGRRVVTVAVTYCFAPTTATATRRGARARATPVADRRRRPLATGPAF